MASAYLFAMLAVTPSKSREVALIANPEFEAGRVAGHRARRLIDGGNPALSDPFLLMAEDWVPRDAFSRHPHRGIETVTLVLDGALEHFDSAGNTGVIYTGDAQWMTAGRGVIHNENPLPGTTAHALQLWVNLPASEKMAAPRYQDLRGADLPTRREPGVEIRLLSGSSWGVSSPTLNHVPVTAIDARMDDGATFEHELEAGANAFLLVLEGSAIVGRQERPVASGELAWLTRSDEARAALHGVRIPQARRVRSASRGLSISRD
jgi:redox-sensitive bicupin YhaK (pirin superfamily)